MKYFLILGCLLGGWWVYTDWLLPVLAPVPDHVWHLAEWACASWLAWRGLNAIS